MKKAAGYVRVSTPGQVDDESLTTQRKSITEFAKSQQYELTEIYADEGISGGSIINRYGLQKCIKDGLQGKFKVLIIHRLSRFGRNALELLNNYKELKAAGIELRSISEGIDFSTKYGEAMLGMLAIIAQLERDIIKETMLENRVAKAKRGIPTSGKFPYGRTFDPKTETWILDEEKAKAIQKAADQYLSGRPLPEIAAELGMTYNNLLNILGKRCGDTWVVKFKDAEPITHIIPRILSDEYIERVQERLEFNRKNNRTDLPGKYVLSGFIRCDVCHSRLSAATINYPDTPIRIYRHKPGESKAFTYIHCDPIEKAVFETIFENIYDAVGFEKAIAESLPDDRLKKELERQIEVNEKNLKNLNKELSKLVQAVLNETLSAETIKAKEKELIKQKENILSHLESDKATLNTLPDVDEVKEEAGRIRQRLLERYSGSKRLFQMSFDEKRGLLHWLFDGKDQHGTPYGIYIKATGKRKNQ
ncbi:MAG: recombinase family protein, partial [Candidatus Cloacimonetes bacterium]|nr:recombinase family protein [Candidatus Cloacimonadota bacterium]